MAHEQEAFGFFFSGHPVDAYANVLTANQVVSFGEVQGMTAPLGGGKKMVMMAGRLEERRWRNTQSGKRYQFLSLSDRSGQYVTSCFDEELQEKIEALANESPALLIGMELQWKDGEDVPRLTLRSCQPLADLARRTRGRMVVQITHPAEVGVLLQVVSTCQAQGRGELVAEVITEAGPARLVLGRHYLIDADLEAAVARALGPERVVQEVLEPPQLALVG
jgi:DNA polymerase III subunit alpha